MYNLEQREIRLRSEREGSGHRQVEAGREKAQPAVYDGWIYDGSGSGAFAAKKIHAETLRLEINVCAWLAGPARDAAQFK